MFQVADLRKTTLLECHVKCYCFRHDYHYTPDGEPQGVFFQQHSMRLLHPDDELGAPLLLCVPTVVVHRVDAWSPLLPPWFVRGPSRASALWGNHHKAFRHRRRTSQQRLTPTATLLRSSRSLSAPFRRANSIDETQLDKRRDSQDSLETDEETESDDSLTDAPNAMLHYVFPNPKQRQAEGDVGQKCNAYCKVCGECFPTVKILHKHIQFQAKVERINNQESLGHGKLCNNWNIDDENPYRGQRLENNIKKYLDNRWLEIVCIVEGIEPTTSASVQARHSYTVQDIEWDRTFSPCVNLTSSGGAKIDFEKFHKLIEVNPDNPAEMQADA